MISARESSPDMPLTCVKCSPAFAARSTNQSAAATSRASGRGAWLCGEHALTTNAASARRHAADTVDKTGPGAKEPAHCRGWENLQADAWRSAGFGDRRARRAQDTPSNTRFGVQA